MDDHARVAAAQRHAPPLGSGWETGPVPFKILAPGEAPPTPPAPADAFDALATDLTHLRRACVRSLNPWAEGGPFMLSLIERADLNARLGALQAANATLHPHSRSSDVAAWPSPVLPEGVLIGPRDLIALVTPAIRVALALSARHADRSRDPFLASLARHDGSAPLISNEPRMVSPSNQEHHISSEPLMVSLSNHEGRVHLMVSPSNQEPAA